MQYFWVVSHQRAFITILYHAIEYTVANAINAAYVLDIVERLDVIMLNIQGLSCILIGCIFCDMV